MIAIDMSLTDVLRALGFRHRNSTNTLLPRKDILRGRRVVLAGVTADDTWRWLREQGLLPWSVEEERAAYEEYAAARRTP